MPEEPPTHTTAPKSMTDTDLAICVNLLAATLANQRDLPNVSALLKAVSDRLRRPSARGFCCGTAWEDEIGRTRDGVLVYPSEDAIRRTRTCLDECGLVEVAVRFERWVHEPKPVSEIIQEKKQP